MSEGPKPVNASAKAAAALKVIGGDAAGGLASELGVTPDRVRRWAEFLRESSAEIFEHSEEGPGIGQYRSLLDSITRNVQEAILRSTPEEGLVFVNDAFLNMFGYDSKEEAMNTRPEKFYSDREYRWELVEKMRDEGRIVNAEVQFRRRDGSEFWGLENSILVEVDGKVYIDAIVHDITERKQFESRIQESLREKEVLLGEIHHRVKNNLAVISGLLYLQAEKSGDSKARDLLTQSRSRINSMAIVHEMLYQNSTFSSIDPTRYVEELVDYIRSELEVSAEGIEVDVRSGGLQLDMNTAVPCALILHELLSNAFKYAFPDDNSGTLEVSLESKGDRCRVIVRDDGQGIPEQVLENLEREPSLGLFLVHTLVEQLNGEIEIFTGVGTQVEITFPL